MKTKVICPMCWSGRGFNPAESSDICTLCQQMIGRTGMRSLEQVVEHYRKLIDSPDVPQKMKDYINFRTIDLVKEHVIRL